MWNLAPFLLIDCDCFGVDIFVPMCRRLPLNSCLHILVVLYLVMFLYCYDCKCLYVYTCTYLYYLLITIAPSTHSKTIRCDSVTAVNEIEVFIFCLSSCALRVASILFQVLPSHLVNIYSIYGIVIAAVA